MDGAHMNFYNFQAKFSMNIFSRYYIIKDQVMNKRSKYGECLPVLIRGRKVNKHLELVLISTVVSTAIHLQTHSIYLHLQTLLGISASDHPGSPSLFWRCYQQYPASHRAVTMGPCLHLSPFSH